MLEFGLGGAREEQGVFIGRGDLNIDHLHGLERLNRGTRRAARSPLSQLMFECHLKAIGEEGHKDVRLDAILELMVKGGMARSFLSSLKACSTHVELHIEGPEGSRVVAVPVGAQ